MIFWLIGVAAAVELAPGVPAGSWTIEETTVETVGAGDSKASSRVTYVTRLEVSRGGRFKADSLAWTATVDRVRSERDDGDGYKVVYDSTQGEPTSVKQAVTGAAVGLSWEVNLTAKGTALVQTDLSARRAWLSDNLEVDPSLLDMLVGSYTKPALERAETLHWEGLPRRSAQVGDTWVDTDTSSARSWQLKSYDNGVAEVSAHLALPPNPRIPDLSCRKRVRLRDDGVPERIQVDCRGTGPDGPVQLSKTATWAKSKP